jgi:cobalt-zinc-cadmium efflux system outer membrane protein
MSKYVYVCFTALSVLGCAASSDHYRALRVDAFGDSESSDGISDAADVAAVEWPQSGVLTLEPLIELSLARNPTLASMRETWRVAVERYPQAVALADPQFGYAFAPASIDSDNSIYGQKIEISQRLPWPGKLKLRGEAALSRAEEAGLGVEDARLHLVRSVTDAFYAYQFVHRAIDINRTNQDLLVEFQHIAERRYAAGLTSKSDVLQAEVEHQHLVHRGITLEREKAVIQARLNTLLDLPPKNFLPRPATELPHPAGLPALSVLESRALGQRPELRALAHTVNARSAEVEIARREYFPDFSVNASYNSLWEVKDKRTVVGLAINVPLQLERRRAALSQARAEQRHAVALLEERRAETLLRINEAYDELLETRHVVHLYGSSILPAARESLETAQSGYEAGSNDFLTLVATKRTFHLTELNHEQALLHYQQGLARLEYAVGVPLDGLEESR